MHLAFAINVVLVTSVVAPVSAQQFLVRTDAQLASTHVWRGFDRSRTWQLQTDAAVGMQIGHALLSAGGWLNLELGHHRDGHLQDPAPQQKHVSELDGWLQYSNGHGELRWDLAVVRYHFTRVDGLDATEATGDLFVQHGRWVPRMKVAKRIGSKGTYLEPSVTFHHFVSPFEGPGITLSTTLEAGIQAASPSVASALPVAVKTGFSHVAFSAALRITIYPVNSLAVFIGVSSRVQWSADSLMRQGTSTYPLSRGPFHVWVPLVIGVSFPMTRRQW
jgi:hypothetical protein